MSQTLFSLAGFQVITIGRFWLIAEGHWVRGYWRGQAYGPNNSQHKEVWIEPFWRGGEWSSCESRQARAAVGGWSRGGAGMPVGWKVKS